MSSTPPTTDFWEARVTKSGKEWLWRILQKSFLSWSASATLSLTVFPFLPFLALMEQVVILLRAELAQGSISSGQEEKVTATGPREYACLVTLMPEN